MHLQTYLTDIFLCHCWMSKIVLQSAHRGKVSFKQRIMFGVKNYLPVFQLKFCPKMGKERLPDKSGPVLGCEDKRPIHIFECPASTPWLKWGQIVATIGRRSIADWQPGFMIVCPFVIGGELMMRRAWWTNGWLHPIARWLHRFAAFLPKRCATLNFANLCDSNQWYNDVVSEILDERNCLGLYNNEAGSSLNGKLALKGVQYIRAVLTCLWSSDEIAIQTSMQTSIDEQQAVA